MGQEIDLQKRVVEELVLNAQRLLARYPLCDRCLGRMFALLGRGLTNAERGRALKIIVTQLFHARIREGDPSAVEEFRSMAPNIGVVASKLYEELFGEQLRPRQCYICGSRLEEYIGAAARQAAHMLQSEYEVKTFIVAAHVAREVVEKETDIKVRYRLKYAETIGSEVKREVSKLLQATTGLRPDFERPHVVVEVYIPGGLARITPLPLLIECRYWKLGRRISQSKWILYNGEKKYALSVEEYAESLLNSLGGERVVVHAAGREDVDARMLGTGRPCIIEVKKPRRRTSVDKIVEEQRGYTVLERLVKIVLGPETTRRRVQELKELETAYKTYRVLVYSEEPIESHELKALERRFNNTIVRQRTPSRVRHRRADLVRERVVYSVRARKVTSNVFEAIVVAEGGLYIKELVSGDNGGTRPSFAEVLGKRLSCVELDVIAVNTK